MELSITFQHLKSHDWLPQPRYQPGGHPPTQLGFPVGFQSRQWEASSWPSRRSESGTHHPPTTLRKTVTTGSTSLSGGTLGRQAQLLTPAMPRMTTRLGVAGSHGDLLETSTWNRPSESRTWERPFPFLKCFRSFPNWRDLPDVTPGIDPWARVWQAAPCDK